MVTLDQLVLPETAKLLMGNGFDSKEYLGNFWYDEAGGLYNNNAAQENFNEKLIPAPSQSIAARWLREKKGLFIRIDYYFITKTYQYEIQVVEDNYSYRTEAPFDFDTYEQAMEAAIVSATKGNFIK